MGAWSGRVVREHNGSINLYTFCCKIVVAGIGELQYSSSIGSEVQPTNPKPSRRFNMAKLVNGVTQIDRTPVFYTSNGYKFNTATQANVYQRQLNRQNKMRAIVAEVCGTPSSNRYIVNVSDVISAVRDPQKLAALLKLASM